MVFSQILKSCRSSSSKNYKADKDFAKRHGFKYIELAVKARDIHKIEKGNAIGISTFDYENKVKYRIYVSKTYTAKLNMSIYYW